ncbi:MAG: hypothetical protein ACT4N9_10015 [Paracoccaceae bacterium]
MRFREAGFAGIVLLAGLWLIWLGGWVLVPAGLVVAALGVSLLRHALARLSFQQAVGAPGVVELDEAQLGYMGPQAGGFISLAEAVELRLITLQGRRLWRVKQADGQAMLVPVDAEGAGQLFDAFAALPGMDVGALSRAVAAAAGGAAAGGGTLVPADPQMQVIWRREGGRALPTGSGR